MLKYKPKGNSLPTVEVNTARNKLEDILQTLVDKKDDSGAGATGSDTTEVGSTPSTPPRRGHFVPRLHRKRKKLTQLEVEPETEQHHHNTYIMKLFERSLDLAQFNEDSSLYPICRAWIRNQPHNMHLGPRDRSPTPRPDDSYEEDEDGEKGSVYDLPPPTEIKSEEYMEGVHDLRIPSLLPDGTTASSSGNSSPEQLLLGHMARWKAVRQRWLEASRQNEARYAYSFSVLQTMHDAHQGDK